MYNALPLPKRRLPQPPEPQHCIIFSTTIIGPISFASKSKAMVKIREVQQFNNSK